LEGFCYLGYSRHGDPFVMFGLEHHHHARESPLLHLTLMHMG